MDRLLKVVVTPGRNLILLEILLSLEDNGFFLNFSVLNTHCVAMQLDEDVFIYSYQLSVPLRCTLVTLDVTSNIIMACWAWIK